MDARKDLIRFSKLRSWQRYLPLEGRKYLAFPWKGPQPASTLDKIEDDNELHWWFWEADFIDEVPIRGKAKEIIMQNSIKFNCFLRGLDKCLDGTLQIKGVFIIQNRNPNMEDILRGRQDEFGKNITIEDLIKMDYELQIKKALKTIKKIYDRLYSKFPEYVVNSYQIRKTTPSPPGIPGIRVKKVLKRNVSFSSDSMSHIEMEIVDDEMERKKSSSPGTPRRLPTLAIRRICKTVSNNISPRSRGPNTP